MSNVQPLTPHDVTFEWDLDTYIEQVNNVLASTAWSKHDVKEGRRMWLSISSAAWDLVVKTFEHAGWEIEEDTPDESLDRRSKSFLIRPSQEVLQGEDV